MIPSILLGLAAVAEMFFNALSLVIFLSVLMSWFEANPSNQLFQMVEAITRPMYRPFRRLTRHIPGPLDFAPLIVLMIIVFLNKAIPTYLRFLARDME